MEKVTSKDGTPIAFDRYGAGPAVILIGGAFQQRAFDAKTAQIAQMLSAYHTVYHYDRRGRGDSGDTPPYAIQREVEDLEALIENAGQPAFLFGMSSGAVLALNAAAGGLDILKLALYEPPYSYAASSELNGPSAVEEYSRQLNTLLAEGQRGEAAALAMRTFGTPDEMITGMRQAPVWPVFEAVAPTLAYDAALMGDGRVPASRLSRIYVPTLVIAGGASPDWMRRAAQEVAAALPDATSYILEDQTHDVEPAALAPVLAQFFAR